MPRLLHRQDLRSIASLPSVSRHSLLRATAITGGVLAAMLVLAPIKVNAQAVNASWSATPANNNYENPANWTGGVVPDSAGTATFGASTITTLSSTGPFRVGGLTFSAGAPAYTFNISVFNGHGILGAGIVNGRNQTIVINATQFWFQNTSTAGEASFTVNAGLRFLGNSTAGASIITTNGGGFGGNGTGFENDSSGGTSTHIIGTNGLLYIDAHGGAGVTIGSLAGAGTVAIGGKTLTIGSNNTSTTYSGVIQNLGRFVAATVAGNLVKTGTGTLTLTGTNAYTGTTTVNGGTLAVNGSIATSSGVTVNTGGTLGGTGTLPGTIINSGGTLSPGNSVGTLRVNGNLTLNAGSTTRIEVQGATIDRVNVTGTATLGGAVTFVPTGGTYTFNSPYTFIQAGTLTGTFATSTVNGSFGAGVTPTVSYTGTEARLTLAPAPLVPIVNSTSSTPGFSQSGGSNGNRLGVAGALDSAVARGQDVSPFFNLYNQTPGGIARGLDVTSGQVGSTTSTMTVDASNQFLFAVLDPNSRSPDGGTGPLAAAGPQTVEMTDAPGRPRRAALLDPRTTIWAKAFGGFGSFRADAGIGTFAQTNSNLGIVVGADYRITPDLLVGVAMGGSSGWATNANGLGRASSDTFQTSLYGAANLGQFRLLGAVSYALTDVTTIRQIPFAAVGDLTGRLKASAFSGRIEAGWRMDDVGIRGLALTPFAAFQSQWVFTPRYTEGTPNAALLPFALTYSARTNATVRTELGLRTDYAVSKDVALFARVGWAAYLVRDTAFTAGFASLPGTSFTATGGRPGPHAAIGSLGFDWLITPMTTLTARVDGEISDRHAVANGSVRMQVRF